MAELIAKTPCAGLLPVNRGEMTLSEIDLGPAYMVLPFKGQGKAVGELLGAALPKPNRSTGKTGARVLWFGREGYLVTGQEMPDGIDALAAVSDQSDAWAVVTLEGPGAEAVLSRLVPVDLRGKTFKRGHTCRTMLEHMNVSITRIGEKTFQIMAFRSMAGTLVHDLAKAMEQVAVRSGN